MSIKSKVFAAAATLTLVGGVGSVAALSAGAATPSCGHDCIDIFSRQFGTHQSPACMPLISMPATMASTMLACAAI